MNVIKSNDSVIIGITKHWIRLMKCRRQLSCQSICQRISEFDDTLSSGKFYFSLYLAIAVESRSSQESHCRFSWTKLLAVYNIEQETCLSIKIGLKMRPLIYRITKLERHKNDFLLQIFMNFITSLEQWSNQIEYQYLHAIW